MTTPNYMRNIETDNSKPSYISGGQQQPAYISGTQDNSVPSYANCANRTSTNENTATSQATGNNPSYAASSVNTSQTSNSYNKTPSYLSNTQETPQAIPTSANDFQNGKSPISPAASEPVGPSNEEEAMEDSKVVEKKMKETESVPMPPEEIRNRKALIIGINYDSLPKGAQLKGCHTDAKRVKEFLSLTRNFELDNIRVLMDVSGNPDGQPSKENMINGMKWLVEGAQKGDSLFFHYSGHGGQQEDTTGMEEDGLDETILPLDFQTAGHITDDTIHDLLVRPLPAGVRLTAIFDSCHSQTAMDLPYVYHAKDEYKTAHKKNDGGILGRHLTKEILNPVKLVEHVRNEVDHQKTKHRCRRKCEEQNTSKALVMMIAGCRDDQTSSDTTIDGETTGAMSYAFSKVLNLHPNQTWATLITEMRDLLHKGDKQFEQMPQLSMGRPVDPTKLKVIF